MITARQWNMNEIQKYNGSFLRFKGGNRLFQHSRIVETSSVVMELHQGNNNVTGIEQGEVEDKETAVQLHVDEGDFSLLGPRNGYSGGLYDKPLSCFGCGIGWFSFLLGFAFPPLWYYATVFILRNIISKTRGKDLVLQHQQLQL